MNIDTTTPTRPTSARLDRADVRRSNLPSRTARIGGWRVLTVGAVVGAIGLTACGSGEDRTDSAEADTPAAVAAGPDVAARGDGAAAGSPKAAPSPEGSEEAAARSLDEGGPLDVCALVSSADVGAAFGVEFDDGELTHLDQTGGDHCIWNALDPMTVQMFSLSVQRDRDLPDEWHDNGIDAERLFDETRSMDGDGVDMALGEKAYASGSTVHVFYDDTIYDFMTVGDTPEDIAGVQALATATMESVTS
jgi:hypothetical protein